MLWTGLYGLLTALALWATLGVRKHPDGVALTGAAAVMAIYFAASNACYFCLPSLARLMGHDDVSRVALAPFCDGACALILALTWFRTMLVWKLALVILFAVSSEVDYRFITAGDFTPDVVTTYFTTLNAIFVLQLVCIGLTALSMRRALDREAAWPDDALVGKNHSPLPALQRTASMLHHKGRGAVRPPAQASTKVHKEAGSGSRPTMSKHGIMDSSPAHPHKLDRAPKGFLK